MELTQKDLIYLQEKGITPEKLENQLRMFAEGFPFLRLQGAATPGNGITIVTPDMEAHSLEIWKQYLEAGGKVVKMVPASGAASRMFKDLFAFINGESDEPESDFMRNFFRDIEKFAFFPLLNATTLRLFGKSVHTLIEEKRFKDVVHALLDKEGLNYGQLPKALLEFHRIWGGSHTPLEEHLSEGIEYAAGKGNTVRIHFTVSPEHRPLLEKKIEEVKLMFEKRHGIRLEITMSEQKPSTDTVAVTVDNTPYREEDTLFFRPGGHGALIENLNEIDADIVFIKNIDNVVPDSKRDITNRYTKILGGILVATKQKADEYCRILKKKKVEEKELDEIEKFLRDNLHIQWPNPAGMSP